jgi:uncharacterized membrane protein
MDRKTYLVIMTIAAALRILFIARAPLWYDENFTLILARLPFDKMIAATAGDVHPPLWYLIEWSIFHVAPSLPVWMIRIPALIFSLLAINTFVLLCETLLIPNRVRTVATLLMAILPMQIWYAQEGRMYAMLEFLVLLALYAGLNKKWIMFAGASVAMMYTQNYGMFYLAVIGMIVIILDWRSVTKVAGIAIITVSLYSPWAFIVARQMTAIQGRYWIMDASAGAVLGTIYKQFWASSMMSQGVIASYVITFALILIGVWAVMRERVASWWIVMSMAFAPVGLALIASWVWQPLLLFRPLIGISPFLYLIVAWPVMSVQTFKRVNVQTLYASCFIVPMLMFGVAGYYINITAMKGAGAVSPMTDILTYVRANWREGDVLYYTDDGPMINLMPYADATMPQYKMPECDTITGYAPVLGSLSVATRDAIGSRIAELNDVPHKRAWVFAPRSPLHPQCYEAQIADIASGAPLILVDDNKFITSGVWLVTK